MNLPQSDGYWSTPEARRRLYESRRSRRLLLQLFDTEAVNKKQARGELARTFQNAIRTELATLRRRAFKGGICLSLEFETSRRQPAPIQTLAKNYLDLLGRATHIDDSKEVRRLLYGDDSQVHVLSVSCRHGVDNPTFTLTAGRLSDFIADLQYTSYLEGEHPDLTERDMHAEYQYDAFLDSLREAAQMSPEELATDLGRLKKTLAETSDRRVVQEHLLKNGQIRLRELADLYASEVGNSSRHSLLRELRHQTERWVVQSPFRIELPALPTVGESDKFRGAVRNQVKSFHDKLAHLMQPLKMQVGLEVVVRPRHGANKAELFDLDNLVRDYLLPQVLEQFSPPSDFLHTVDFGNDADDAPFLSDMRQRRDALPKGVHIGVFRYEVFRLPPATAESPSGYVTLNLKDCTYGGGSIFSRIDDVADRAKDLQERR